MAATVRTLRPPVAQLQLRIELEWVTPSVWRRVLVPETITLAQLHRVIQVAMGWSDSHLHEFAVGRERYGTPDPDWDALGAVHSERGVALRTALGRAKRIEYSYDFGDGWQHVITVEKVLAPSAHGYRAECIGGESACPPEDVGGPPGYAYFLEALADPAHEEHEDMRRWCGGAFDATAFDIKRVNQRLGRLRL